MSDNLSTRPDAAATRKQAFVDAAREAFFERGYGSTTMSAIAGLVGGSKTTLWNYFPSKEDLFAAVVDDILKRYGGALAVDLSPDDDIGVVLNKFGNALMDTLLSEPVLSLNRLLVAEAKRFPHLAALYHERAPRPGRMRIAVYFEALMTQGKLRRGDATLAMKQFIGMCQSVTFQQALLNLPPECGAAASGREIEAAVASFLRAWKP
jgi:AcrR family transcriptional regulator